MCITNEVLKELIANEGELKHTPVATVGVFRLALDLQEARELIGQLQKELAQRPPSKKKKK